MHAPVAELDHLREVVTRVDVHDGKRELARSERLLGQTQQHDRVFAAGEEQHGTLELGRDLAEDVDRLCFEVVQVRQRARACAHACTTFSAARRSITTAADSDGLTPVVSSVISGLLGVS
jgi:hypothetical protein